MIDTERVTDYARRKGELAQLVRIAGAGPRELMQLYEGSACTWPRFMQVVQEAYDAAHRMHMDDESAWQLLNHWLIIERPLPPVLMPLHILFWETLKAPFRWFVERVRG